MADKKISQLPDASTPLVGTEVLPIVQSAATVKVSTDNLTVKNVRSNATTGILQVTGPAALATRVMTVPDANFTVARTDAGQTFTGTQVMTSPQVLTSVNDTNGNELIGITATASAVNEITVANAATGNAPTISATGSDTNIGIRLTPKGSGNAILTSGNLVVANGNGIDFSATAGSGTSELFSDYEEGDFTPVLVFSGSNTYVNAGRSGYYIKVGRTVTITGTCFLDKSTASGSVTITNLPFTSAATSAGNASVSVFVGRVGKASNVVTGLLGGGSSTILLYATPQSTSLYAALTDAEISGADTAFFAVTATYIAA